MGPSSIVNLITDAGDAGVLMPLAAVACLVLWLVQSGHTAWLMARSVIASGGLTVVLKLFFLSCGSHWQAGLLSPSGHACLSAVVYGCLGTVAATGRPPAVRWAIGLAVTVLVGIIAVTRITLGVHTWIEVCVGLAVGIAGVLWFARSMKRSSPRRVDARVFGVAVAVTILCAFGLRFHTETFLRHLAKRLGESCEAIRAEGGAVLPAQRFGGPAQPPARTIATSSASARAGWS